VCLTRNPTPTHGTAAVSHADNACQIKCKTDASTHVRCGGWRGKGEKEADVRRPRTLYSCDHIILDHTSFGSMVTDDYYE